MSTKSLMGALSDCFPSSFCLLLRKYWNLVTNNNNVRKKETKIWQPFKTSCSLSFPRCAAYHKGNNACIVHSISTPTNELKLKEQDFVIYIEVHFMVNFH